MNLVAVPSEVYIAGQWRSTGETRPVISPYDGQTVGEFAWAGRKEAKDAVDAAAEAMRSPVPAHRRARILEEAARLVRERRMDFARTITLETGKPLSASLAEVDRADQTLLFSAAAVRTLGGEVVPMDAHPSGEGRLGVVLHFPIGVAAAITPFNFPLNLAVHKIAPAFAAGCACVLKPADKAPLSALLLTQILETAGLPPGWLNTVTGDPEEIAGIFVEDDRVRVISFTGSAEIGWRLRARAPKKKVLLELGNSTPLIVLADADLEAAAEVVVANGYSFSGQTCISVQRVFVAEALYDRLVARLLPAIAKLRAGDPLDPATQIGPLITKTSFDRILNWVKEAQGEGAQLLTGEIEAAGTVLRPILMGDVSETMSVSCREIFGPVVVLSKIASLEEAVVKANNTPYGLQASIFTRDVSAAMNVVSRLDFGAVMINESPSFRADQMPYGGNKESGNTREGPAYAIEEFSQQRTVILRFAR